MAESFLDRLRSIGQDSYSSPKEKNKPSAVLSDEYRSFVDELPGDVQNEVDRYLNIFKNDPTPVNTIFWMSIKKMDTLIILIDLFFH